LNRIAARLGPGKESVAGSPISPDSLDSKSSGSASPTLRRGILGVGGSRELKAWPQQLGGRVCSRTRQPWSAVDIGNVFCAVEILLLAGFTPQIKNYRLGFAPRFGCAGLARCHGLFGSGRQRNWLTTGATIDSRVLLRYGYLGHGTPHLEVGLSWVGRNIIQCWHVRK
jgi:hypothetical protein